jgi:hypothetical protein
MRDRAGRWGIVSPDIVPATDVATDPGEPPMKPALLAASLLLVGGAAAGCGGGAPTDASAEDFCETYNSLFTEMADMADASEKEILATIKDWGTRMNETGTPEDISDDARAGFEQTVVMLGDLDEDASQEDFDKVEQELSDEEKKQVDAFDTYTTDTCEPPNDQVTPEAPAESPTEAP